ncbi:MAG: peroxidase family protein, partial [Bacteroidota bacterium]
MLRILLLITGLLSVGLSAWSQEYRTIDGTNNNQQNPTWGAADTEMPRLVPPAYGDGISALGGIGWPNPRVVSNTLFSQANPLIDPMNLSDYCWAFGQFIDHDITFVLDQTNGWLFIQVPAGDPDFDPWGIGQALIPMRRSAATPGTGLDANNPRQHNNVITAFIDGSAVYGSDQVSADWLRSFTEGKMKVSDGNLLPYNTTTGEFDGPIDPDAPHMENPVGAEDRLFVAGDARANENLLLLTFHTLFVREHNRLCDSLVLVHPDWDDEQLYQHARKLVGGKIAAIVYEEWLPTMGVDIPEYASYDPAVDPRITNVFSAAAFRLGHTLLNENILRIDAEGEVVPGGNLDLKDAFFLPSQIQETGLDPLCKGMGIQVQQSMDGKVVNAIRNFLFGPPGAGGLDLASINMARGRERGIPDFNTIRMALGLGAYTDFFDLTNDVVLAGDMEDLYGSIDNCDAWTGFLIEERMPNALFGPTLMKVMEQQFADLRDGDRFYYENDSDLSPEEIATIKGTRMVDIVLNNTDLDIMQENIFIAMPHEMLCTAPNALETVSGTVALENGLNLEGIEVNVEVDGLGTIVGTQITGPGGTFSISN